MYTGMKCAGYRTCMKNAKCVYEIDGTVGRFWSSEHVHNCMLVPSAIAHGRSFRTMLYILSKNHCNKDSVLFIIMRNNNICNFYSFLNIRSETIVRLVRYIISLILLLQFHHFHFFELNLDIAVFKSPILTSVKTSV